MIREVVLGPIAKYEYTAVGPDRFDRCNLLGYRIITAAVMHFTSFLFPIPFIVMLALLSRSQSYNLDPGSCSGLPSPLPTTVPALAFIARRNQHFLPPSIRVEL